MAHLGHPLLGDEVYGSGFKTKASQLRPAAQKELGLLGRQALHAYLLALEHPMTGEVMEWQTPWPPDLDRLKQALGKT
jgi:23S rRNA pseudouridine1911/1915/1917 synthase